MKAKFERVLLKLSGEALMGTDEFGVNYKTILNIAKQIKSVININVQLSVVIGGGNIFRGINGSSFSIERTTADHMGMLATVFNSLVLESLLKKIGVSAVVQSAIFMDKIAEPYVLKKALYYLENKNVVIFAAGSGNPYFTTDTAAVLRAVETHSDILIKATKVDGLYDSDPILNSEAKFIKSIKYIDVIEKRLKVMDLTAISLAMDNKLPLIVFNINKSDNIIKVISGENIGTYISD